MKRITLRKRVQRQEIIYQPLSKLARMRRRFAGGNLAYTRLQWGLLIGIDHPRPQDVNTGEVIEKMAIWERVYGQIFWQ